MSIEEIIETLTHDFIYFGISVPPKVVLEKCAELCNEENLTTEAFVEQWLSFSMFSTVNKDGTTPTSQNLELFRRYLAEQIEKQQKNKSKKIIDNSFTKKDQILNSNKESSTEKNSTSKRLRDEHSDEVQIHSAKRSKESTKHVENGDLLSIQDNQSKNDSIISQQDSLSQSLYLKHEEDDIVGLYEKFTERKDALTVLDSYDSKLLKNKATFKTSGSDDKIIINHCAKQHMLKSDATLYHDVKTMKMVCLNRKIDMIGRYLIKKFQLEKPEPFIALPYVPETAVVFGRICKGTNSKLDKNTVLLESSVNFNNGESVSLDLYNVNMASLFPGQIVAMNASKGRQGSITIGNVYSDASMNFPEAIPKLNITGALQIVLAAGPFTINNNLLYEPLIELMSYVDEHKPHILILMGPFLDASHGNVTKESFMASYETNFEVLINGIMKKLAEKQSNTQIVIISSSRDLHHCNVYPTPPYSLEDKYPNLHLMPDPSVLNINGLNIGVTSTDILFHLNKEEVFVSKAGQMSNRMSRIAKHIISQQCFYPLYPSSKEICMDIQLLQKHGHFKHTPHIMILPSNLRYFVKNIDGCIVVNPERLSKGYSGGTFARMEVHPNQTTQSAADNIICEILKI